METVIIKAYGEEPNPALAKDLAELIEILRQLRTWVGNPSFRTLAKKAGALMTPPRNVSQSTVGEVFQTRRRLDIELLIAIVRALGVGRHAERQWRLSYLRVSQGDGPGSATSTRHSLPAELPGYIGRDHDLMHLTALAGRMSPSPSATAPVIVIEGMAGIGKTSLAIRTAHRLVGAGRFTDAQLVADFHAFDESRELRSATDVCAGFLQELGLRRPQIPVERGARVSMFRRLMLDFSALLIMDNVRRLDDVVDLIPANPACLVVITTRRSVGSAPGVYVHRVRPLAPGEATSLLAQTIDAARLAADPQAVTELVAACGGLPLALALAAARLESRPDGQVSDLRYRLQAEDLGVLAVGSRSLISSFDSSYAALDLEGRRVFRSWGCTALETSTPG